MKAPAGPSCSLRSTSYFLRIYAPCLCGLLFRFASLRYEVHPASSLNLQYNLSKLRTLFHASMRGRRVGQRKYLVDDRPQPVSLI